MDWQLAVLNPSMTTLLLGYYRTPADKRDPAAVFASVRKTATAWIAQPDRRERVSR